MNPSAPVPVYSADYLRRCREVTDLALGEVPAYRDWARFDTAPDDPLARLAALPVMDKEHMRALGPSAFVSPPHDLQKALAAGEVEIVHTSGSMGDRVENVWCQSWWNASEEASWNLHSRLRQICDGRHREAILASPLCVGVPCETDYLDRTQRTLGRFLFLNERVNPGAWTPAHMDRMLEEINDFQPAVLEASPSYLARLCRHASRRGRPVHHPGVIVLTFENPSRMHLRLIRAVFESPVISSYGATEAGYVFMECECGRLHQNTGFCHVDFIPFAPCHGGPAIGAILVTTFRNPWRVLIRFDICDVARLAAEPCPCGRREGLTLDSIEGRGINLTVTPDGRAVTQNAVDRLIGGEPDLDNYQLLQISEHDYVLRIVCRDGSEQTLPDRLLPRLHVLYGTEARIRIEKVAVLEPDPPGKFRLCKPLVPVDPRSFWDPRVAPPAFPMHENRSGE